MKFLDKYRPRFTHDCESCRFLFREEDMDIYWCAGDSGGSLIARTGNDAPDYSSSPAAVVLYSGLDSKYSRALRKGLAYLAEKGMLRLQVNDKAVSEWDECFRD